MSTQDAKLQVEGFLWFSQTYLMSGSWFAQVLRKVRRMYFSYFKREYVAASIAANRKEDCHRCGACCELVFKCPFLGKDSESLPYCRIYGDLRPDSCRNYPFDRVDSEVAQCGFRFK